MINLILITTNAGIVHAANYFYLPSDRGSPTDLLLLLETAVAKVLFSGDFMAWPPLISLFPQRLFILIGFQGSKDTIDGRIIRKEEEGDF